MVPHVTNRGLHCTFRPQVPGRFKQTPPRPKRKHRSTRGVGLDQRAFAAGTGGDTYYNSLLLADDVLCIRRWIQTQDESAWLNYTAQVESESSRTIRLSCRPLSATLHRIICQLIRFFERQERAYRVRSYLLPPPHTLYCTFTVECH